MLSFANKVFYRVTIPAFFIHKTIEIFILECNFFGQHAKTLLGVWVNFKPFLFKNSIIDLRQLW